MPKGTKPRGTTTRKVQWRIDPRMEIERAKQPVAKLTIYFRGERVTVKDQRQVSLDARARCSIEHHEVLSRCGTKQCHTITQPIVPTRIQMLPMKSKSLRICAGTWCGGASSLVAEEIMSCESSGRPDDPDFGLS